MIFLEPALKDYIWGGDKLLSYYHDDENMTNIAEAWLLSNHKDGESIVKDGEYKGLKFSEYIEKIGFEGLGKRCAQMFDRFPILIKLIDAQKPLSIQVHPTDEYALENENEYGKAEMWHIIDAQPNSYLYYGLNKTLTKDEFKKRIEDNTLLEVLNKVKVEKGDTVFVEPGTLHAIGEGIMLCEIQENSNLTYRVYDYGRKDKEGNLRELHIDKALEVTNLNKTNVGALKRPFAKIGDNKIYTLIQCRYFKTKLVDLDDEYMEKVSTMSFLSIISLDDGVKLYNRSKVYSLRKGDSVFCKAGANDIIFRGKGRLILTTV